MKFFDIMRISWKNLLGNRMRTLLTVMGIAVGIGAIVFLVSLGYGLQELSIKKITSISSLTALDVAPAQNAIVIDGGALADLSKINSVEKISPLLSLAGQVSSGASKVDVVANGVNSDYFGYQGLKVAAGGIFDDNENKIVVSSALAKALNMDSQGLLSKELVFTAFFPGENVPSDFTKKDYNLSVVGIIDDSSTAFIYIPLNVIKGDLSSNVVYNSAKAKVNDQENLTQVKSAIEAKGFKVTSVADTIGQVYSIFRIVQIVLALFGVIALVVASIGMFNTMTIALLERTRDIGIMKAVGVQNNTVRKMFLVESFLISLIGGIFGVVLGMFSSRFVNFLVNVLAKSVGGEAEKLFSTPVYLAFGIIGFSMIVGITTGFYPAHRASNLNPLDALRYE